MEPGQPNFVTQDNSPEGRRISQEMRNFVLRKCPLTLDPISFVLRIHLVTEHYMNRFLVACLPKCEQFLGKDAVKLGYHEKARIIGSLDILPQEVIHFLLDLNALRNQLAHNLDRDITKDDVDKLGRYLGADDYRAMCGIVAPSDVLYSCLTSLCGRLAGSVMRIEKYATEDNWGKSPMALDK